MAEEETEDTTEETAAAEAPAEDAAPEAAPEQDPLADLPWKERRRVLKSRESGPAGPERSPEERQADREQARAAKAKARRKRRAEAREAATDGPREGTPPAEKVRIGRPKERQGIVVSDRADKTLTVQINSAHRHKVYEKIVRTTHKIHVHDEQNEAREGDVVRVIETRKLSRTKHWRLVEIVERAK